MKGLKKIALVSAIAAVSAGAQAELKALDDSAMGELTGQAGLTIDVETKYTIGEFQYKDAGSLFINNISLGGNKNEVDASGNINNTYLDNFRMTIDVAGSGAIEASNVAALGGSVVTGRDNAFAYGFAEVRGLALVHATAGGGTDTNFNTVAGGELVATASLNDATGNEFIDAKKNYGDGDLVIHFGFTDAWQKGGGLRAFQAGTGTSGTATGLSLASATFAQAVEVATKAVDFNFSIDAIGIADSGFVTGESADASHIFDYTDAAGKTHKVGTDLVNGLDSDAGDTVLISGLDINGYLGPADLHISNNGNGFGNGAGFGDADSKITWGSYFKITDLDVFIDIAGVMIKGLEIHNKRGDTTGLDIAYQYDAAGNIALDASGNALTETDASGNTVNTSAFGFAHSIREIYAVKDDIVHVTAGLTGGGAGPAAAAAELVDGIALNTRFKGDLDIAHLSFGNTDKSIGEIYLTDITSDTRWTISAH
jgi:Family of unknown function (DUF6160)